MADMKQSEKASALSDFRVLSFDCYGTLVDWESGFIKALQPLLSQLPDTHPFKSSAPEILSIFQKIKAQIFKAQPTLLYSQILQQAYFALAQSLRGPGDPGPSTSLEAERFAASIQDWKAFPDTRDALQRLGRHFRLVILSNVDNVSFRRTLQGPLEGIHFDAIYTAEDIGSYKPDHRNFAYMFSHLRADLGVQEGEVLHVAQSLVNDHVPAKELNIKSAWITRGKEGQKGMGGALQDLRDKVAFSWRFADLSELASAVERERQS
ncbi:HAD-superfamily hydrolase [Aspergillus phoenicis ATCC 13157]|uniref:HAD-superfamily hydrolase n=1 Tax=Aspergillus phoenicis ATCC 13157 TaxID=1353007 RepID=A0A370PGF9_ASPPH|nr:HAD-superfamily hydrolase [Aspergillus phoenicis ATCC 13157]GLA29452.1 hypothetical protein AnigIFM63326_007359 [Aspergillus niger]